MSKKRAAKYDNLAIHAAVWLCLLAVPAILLHRMPIPTGLPRGFFGVTNLFHIGLFYLNALVLYPRLLNKRLWWLYFPALTVLIIACYYLKLESLYALDPDFRLTTFNRRILFFPPVPFLLASIFYRIILDRINYQKKEKELVSERLASELKFLRSQVSPHFLFNTLTNMVALARKKSDLLEASLIRLSDLMRYMLYESGDGPVPLAREIAYLDSYIALQRLRFEDQVAVRTDLPASVPGCLIEPMLLIPFVENAFKHGIPGVREPFIRVSLEAGGCRLLFCVTNSRSRPAVGGDPDSGIGLDNVKNRLALLYPGTHALDIREKEDTFEVTLKIDLE